MDIRAALFACRHVRIKESSTLPLDESFTSTSLQSHIYWTLLHDPHSFSSRQLTRCTSTGRLGTSYLAQRQTKTQPTSASTTPPRVKPRFIWSPFSALFWEDSPSSILHHHLLLVFSRVMLLAVDLFNRPSCACRHMIRTTLPSSFPKTSVQVVDYIPICIFKIISWKPKDMTTPYLPSRPPSQDWTGTHIFYPFCKKQKINWKSWLN